MVVSDGSQVLFSWRIKNIASDFSLKFCSCEFELLTKTNVIDFVQFLSSCQQLHKASVAQK